MRRAEARRRRRDVFVTLLGAVGVTFLLAVALGGSIWMLHLVVDVAFVAYVALLVSLQQQSMEKEQKVRYLPPTAARRPAPTAARRPPLRQLSPPAASSSARRWSRASVTVPSGV